jgi:hypothetical protein
LTDSPTLWTRLLCLLQGEVSAATLEAYRRASLSVFELLEQAEQERLAAAAEGQNPWTIPPAKQAELACTWNAFVLQTLGNAFLDADYRDNPATTGFVPPITADQVLRFYSPVEGWLTRAQQAHADPHFQLDVSIPADIPAWSEVEPCPNSHLHGMLEAMRAIRDHAQSAMNVLENAKDLTPEQEKQRGAIRGIFAAASSKARYADDMHSKNPSREVHEQIEEYLKVAIDQFFLLGQVAAMPQRVNSGTTGKQTTPKTALPTTPASPLKRKPLPREEGFDPWCLTDRQAYHVYRRDPKAKDAVETMWRLDPDPARTLTLKAEIDAAYTRGDITFAMDRAGKSVGYFFCCPWGPIYSVIRPITLGGVRLVPLQQFVYDVTAEGFNLGVPFRRQIKVGNFQPTQVFEYGDPNEAPDH